MAAYTYFSVDSTGMAKTQYASQGGFRTSTNTRFVVGSRGTTQDIGDQMASKRIASRLNSDFVRRQANQRTNMAATRPMASVKGKATGMSAGYRIVSKISKRTGLSSNSLATIGVAAAIVGGRALGAAAGRRANRRAAARAALRRQQATARKRAGANGRGGGSGGGGGRRRTIRRDSHGRFA